MDRRLFVERNSRHDARERACTLACNPPSLSLSLSLSVSVSSLPRYLNSAAKENRRVAVMFIEHDFGGYAGIKRELDCFNEPGRVSRTRTNLRAVATQRHGRYGGMKI